MREKLTTITELDRCSCDNSGVAVRVPTILVRFGAVPDSSPVEARQWGREVFRHDAVIAS